MKKFLPLIGGISVSLLLGAFVGQVTFAEDSELGSGLVDLVLQRHCTDVAAELGEDCIENTYNNDPKELKKLAQNEEVPFYNLYLFTYQNVAEGPKQEAIKQLAKVETEYTQAELEAILFEDNLSVITSRPKLTPEEVADLEAELAELEAQTASEAASLANDESGVSAEFLAYIAQSNYINATRRKLENNADQDSQAYLLREHATLLEAYEQELDFQTENRKLAYQAYATEIFFDNDLSNSGNIDILHDLDLINYLLFGEFIAYPDRTEGGEDVELSSEESPVILPSPQPDEDEVVLSEESESTELNPYVCLEDESLRQSLEAFESYVEESEPETETVPETDSGTSGTSDPEEPSTPEEAEAEAIREEFDAFVEELVVQEGNWDRATPCSPEDVFCITVNLVKGTWGTSSGDAGAFEKSANCIACHLDYIAGATDETLSGGVQPNKVSQNWFEDGTCKDVADGLNLDFHVYAVAVPIALDPSDDTDDLGNEQFESTYNAWVEWSYLNNSNAAGKSPAQFEQETYLKNLQVGGSAQSIEETLATLSSIEELKTVELVEILTGNDIQVKVETSYNLYNQIQNEFNSMLSYFSSYSDWLKSTYLEDDAPLTALIKKPYCP